MAVDCLRPHKGKPKEKYLVDAAGERAAYRMFMKHANLGRDNAIQKSLDLLDAKKYSPEQKKRVLKKTEQMIKGRRFRVDRTFDENGEETGHNYVLIKNGEEINLQSVSEQLDTHVPTQYDGSDAGVGWSRMGTGIHKVPELLINGSNTDVAMTNLEKYVQDGSVSRGFVNDIQVFVNKLKRDGHTIMAETILSDEEYGIAGTVDIIHIKNNGTIDIYDLKTAFYTEWMKKANIKKPWDPTMHEGYKQRRYHAQLEFYSRMIERATGIPVSNKYVVPVEVYTEGNVPDGKISKMQMLAPENVEKHPNWSWGRLARRMVDTFYNVPGFLSEAARPSVEEGSNMNTFMGNVVGNYDGQTVNPELEASSIRRNTLTPIKGMLSYYSKLKKTFIPFVDQENQEAQVNQIVNEEVNVDEKYFNDIAESVNNYLETENDAFIEKFKGSALWNTLGEMRREGKMLPSTDIYSLDSVKGFVKKKNWVVIQNGDTLDLLYIGKENLNQRFKIENRKKSLTRLPRMFFGDTLFGKFFSAGEANYLLKSNLKPIVGDAKKLEGMLIMMELKAQNSDTVFGDVLITSLSQESRETLGAVSPQLLLPTMEKLFNSQDPDVQEILPDNYKEMINRPELFDWQSYQASMLKEYTRYATVIGDARDFKILTGINDYFNNKINNQTLKALIGKEMLNMRYKDKDEKNNARRQILGKMYAELEGLDVHLVEPIQLTKKGFSMSTNMNNEILQNVVANVRTSLTAISRDFFDYKPRIRKSIQALFKSKRSLTSSLADVTISNTSKYYENLFETLPVVVGEDGRTEEVRSFELKKEGSDAFNALTKEEQNTIRLFNDVIQEYTDRIRRTVDPNFNWVRGRVPLLHDNFVNKLYKIMHARSNNLSEEAYDGAIQEMFENVEEGFTFETAKAPDKVNNTFLGQSNDELDPGGWDTRRGIVRTENGYMMVPGSKYGTWSTNLEVILDMFVINALRVEKYNQIMPTFAMAENVLNWQKSKLMEERMGRVIEWLDVWRTGNIENRSQDAGTPLDMTVRGLNKATSLALIGFRPQTAIFATLAQELTAFSQSVAQGIAGTGFGPVDWVEAGVEIMSPANFKNGESKIDLLLEDYRLFNQGLDSMISGYHRWNNRSMFRMRHFYMMLNWGDWFSRAQIMVAQMKDDGVWGAYSQDEMGNLVYDERKDPRFEGENGQALLKSMKSIMLNEDGIWTQEDVESGATTPDMVGRLKRAYDAKESESMKFHADSIIGGFDRETRALYNFWAMGKLFMLFKTWLPARLNKGFDSQFINQVAGSYDFIEDNEGGRTIVWKGKQMEGIMFSMLHGAFNLSQLAKGAETAPLEDFQKENLYRSAGDFILIGGAYMAAASLVTALSDDEEGLDFLEKQFTDIVRRSTEDLLAVYILPITDFGTPISVEYAMRVARNMWNALISTADPDRNSIDYIMKNTSLTNDIRKMWEWSTDND